MSTEVNISTTDGLFIGEDKSLVFSITGDSGAVNITGWTIQWALASALSGTPVLTKSATLTSPGTGICTVDIASGDTIGMTPGTYFHRLRRTDSGSRAELTYGTVALRDVFVD